MTGINLPFHYETIDLSEDEGVFWKQLLPLDGKINYNGEELVFDKEMINGIASSYADKAYDMVPFQLAGDNNKHPDEEPHHMDPRKTHGQLTKLKVDNRGLWGKFKLNDEAQKVLKNTDNKLGVSVSVKRGYKRPDGKFFPYALRHVLGTLDGKVTGMSPWSTVELSNSDSDEKVEDLSGEKVTPAGGEKETKETKETQTPEMVQVPKDQWDNVLSYIEEQKKGDKELEDFLNAEKKVVDASNSGPSQEMIDLSNEVASEKFERYSDNLIRQGVPPAMIDQARRVLGKSNIVDLANDGGEDDPRTVIRKILETAKGTVDLSSATTHSKGSDEDQALDREFKETVLPFFGLGGN